MITEVSLDVIMPHSMNQDIYGDLDYETMSEDQKIEFMKLVDSVRKFGVLEAITLDQQNRIISGERRYRACLFLELKTIPAKSLYYDSESLRLLHLLDSNLQRPKNNTQRIKEGTLREKALEANKKDVLDGSTKKTLRDVVGEQIGMSGKSYQSGKAVLEAVDKLKEDGKDDEAAELEKKLNKSVSGAAKSLNEPASMDLGEFWYKPKLEAIVKMTQKGINGIRGEFRSDTPSGLVRLIESIEKNIADYSTWLGDMEPCIVCSGTMYLKSGDHCRVCVNGKVGKFSNFEKASPIEIEVQED